MSKLKVFYVRNNTAVHLTDSPSKQNALANAIRAHAITSTMRPSLHRQFDKDSALLPLAYTERGFH